MPNRLANENSPYLLQHAENPVDWYPWGTEALEKARFENKPIFLSIGYAACHWCHVMAHESFEDTSVAALMNENFVNIKVDREERPDLDSIYMAAVTALSGQGGWPMSIFLTPDGQPFYGGTYFPPVRRYNMPSFREVLTRVSSAWKNEQQEIVQSSQKVVDYLSQSNSIPGDTQDLHGETLDQAVMTLAQNYDWKSGGWGSAPKFPQPMAIEFLWRKTIHGDHLAKDIATHALTAMARGGMYDIIGGGFARYSTDNDWLVPHFEKMLYDNAQLALAYLHGYLVTGQARFKRVCEETLGFIQRELTHPDGGFYSSLDADSEGQEGKYYTWKASEIKSALSEPLDQEICIATYNITEVGNFDGSNLLRRALTNDELAEQFQLPASEVGRRLDAINALLLAKRQSRIPPATDDKILTAWNALACIAFSEAARYLNVPEYLMMAIRNLRFLLSELYLQGQLFRSWRNKQAHQGAFLEDYAGMILACLSLYQSNPDPFWFESAIDLAEDMMTNFSDPGGAFFDTHRDQQAMIIRPKDFQDNATPCGNSLAATALLQLASFTGRGEWRDKAEGMLRSIQGIGVHYPTSFSNWLCAMDYALTPVQEIALIGEADDARTQALTTIIWSKFQPNRVFACSSLPIPEGSPALLKGRVLVNLLPTVYVCHNFVCSLPVNDPEDLKSQLRN